MIFKIIPHCRQERGNCQICWSATATTDFDVSGKQIYIQTTKRLLMQKLLILWNFFYWIILVLGKADANLASVGNKAGDKCCSYGTKGMRLILVENIYFR